jgi:hypothetical protein
MAEGKKAGRAFIELGVDDKLTKGLEKAQAKLKAFGDGVKALGVGMFAVGGAATGALLTASKVFADVGSAVYDMSKRTGLSAEAVSELGYVAEQAGVEMSALEGGVRRMQKTISEAAGGSQAATEAIEGLGLSLSQLEGKSPEEQFTLIADQLSRIGDPTLRAAMAMEVFGKSGAGLIPMIEGGAKAMEKGRKEARDFGLTISGEAAESADALGDAFGLMGKVARDVLFEIGAALAPVLTDLVGGVTLVVRGVASWVSENQPLIVSALKVSAAVAGIGAGLVAVGAGIVAFGAVLGALGTIFTAVMSVAGAFGAIMGVLLSPVTLVVAGVLAAGAALLYFSGVAGQVTSWVGAQFQTLSEVGNEAFQGISDALQSGDIELSARIAVSGVKAAFFAMMEDVRVMWASWLKGLSDMLATAAFAWDSGVKALEDAWGMTPRPENKKDPLGDYLKALSENESELTRAVTEAVMDAQSARQELRSLAKRASLGVRNREMSGSVDDTTSSVDASDAAIAPVAALAKAPGAITEIMARIGSTGTFNADAALSLQASSSPLQRVAKATERTAENTRRIAEKIENVGSYYTE